MMTKFIYIQRFKLIICILLCAVVVRRRPLLPTHTTERSSERLLMSSLGMMKLVFNVASDGQGSHPDDLSVSVYLSGLFAVQTTMLLFQVLISYRIHGHHQCAHSCPSDLTLNVWWPSYLDLTRSISLLLMPWLLTSPGHQQPWYWLCTIGRFLSYLRKDFNYLRRINVEKLHKM